MILPYFQELAAQAIVEIVGVRPRNVATKVHLGAGRALLLAAVCYVMPFWPGMAAILVGATIERPEQWLFAAGTAALAVAMAFRSRGRTAKALQERIDRLKENPVAALQVGPPSLTRGQHLSVWFLTSFLGATAAGFVIGRFFPEMKADIFGLGGLPAPTWDGVFVLVLIVAGVVAQALWWTLRHRGDGDIVPGILKARAPKCLESSGAWVRA